MDRGRQREPRVRARFARRDRGSAGRGRATGAGQGGARAASNATSRERPTLGDARAAQLAHDEAGFAAEQRALEEIRDASMRSSRTCATRRLRCARGGGREGEARTGRRGAAPGGVGHGGEHRGPAARSRRRRARDRRADRAARPRGVRGPPAPRDAAVRLPEHRSADGNAQRPHRPARGHRTGAQPLRSPQAAGRRRPGDVHAGRNAAALWAVLK